MKGRVPSLNGLQNEKSFAKIAFRDFVAICHQLHWHFIPIFQYINFEIPESFVFYDLDRFVFHNKPLEIPTLPRRMNNRNVLYTN